MKHIIALTTLAAAASAQTAADTGHNYNSITLSRYARQNSLSVQAVLGKSNFVASFATSNDNETSTTTEGQVAVGYVFKGVTNAIDATVGVIQSNEDATVYSIELRRHLNEVYQGLEISAGYAGTLSSQTSVEFIFGGYGVDNSESSNYVGLTYNINKTFAVGVSLSKPSNDNYDRATVFSLRAGF